MYESFKYEQRHGSMHEEVVVNVSLRGRVHYEPSGWRTWILKFLVTATTVPASGQLSQNQVDEMLYKNPASFFFRPFPGDHVTLYIP